MKPVRSLARTMLGAIFVASGVRAASNPDQYVDQAKWVTDRVGPALGRIDPRLPSDARALVRLNGMAQAGGGLLLATGHLTRPAASLLAVSLVPTTIAGHPFWTEEDPERRRTHATHFLKNAGLLGGLLLAAADTQGSPSLGWRVRRAARDGRRRADRLAREGRRRADRMARSADRMARQGRRTAGRRWQQLRNS
jgi:uncharacterized membrane protein YphA (DoxX/SURF4 family)